MADNTPALPPGLPEYLKPALRIFLSVDIVNSTAFKQAAATFVDKKGRGEAIEVGENRAEPWFSPISSFYRGIERRLADEWKRVVKDAAEVEKTDGEAPMLWKASGDEVIYVKKVCDPFQVLMVVRAWMGAVNAHRKELKADFPSLDLKAAAWLAGFPVNNAEVVLRRTPEHGNPLDDLSEGEPLLENFLRLEQLHTLGRHDSGDMFKDFIGPSMDTGFRIASLATPRKFAITIDLAYMLAHSAEAGIPKHLTLNYLKAPLFQYDGRVPLKGVSDGAPYPFFWVDMKDDEELLEVEDDLMGRKRLKCADVLPFCTKFFSEKKRVRGAFMTPYVYGQNQNTSPFGLCPPEHMERLEALSYWSQELEKRRIEKDSQLGVALAEEGPAAPPPVEGAMQPAINSLAMLTKFLIEAAGKGQK